MLDPPQFERRRGEIDDLPAVAHRQGRAREHGEAAGGPADRRQRAVQQPRVLVPALRRERCRAAGAERVEPVHQPPERPPAGQRRQRRAPRVVRRERLDRAGAVAQAERGDRRVLVDRGVAEPARPLLRDHAGQLRRVAPRGEHRGQRPHRRRDVVRVRRLDVRARVGGERLLDAPVGQRPVPAQQPRPPERPRAAVVRLGDEPRERRLRRVRGGDRREPVRGPGLGLGPVPPPVQRHPAERQDAGDQGHPRGPAGDPTLPSPRHRRLDRAEQRVHRLPARLGPRVQPPFRERCEPPRHRPGHRPVPQRLAYRVGVGVGRRALAGEQLADHDAVPVDVAHDPGGPALALLRRHVSRGPEHRADDRGVQGRSAGLPRELARVQAGEAEVHDAHAAVFADHHVVGFEVAMDEPAVVRRRQPATGLQRDLEAHVDGRSMRAQPVAQRVADDQLHRQVDAALVLAGLVDRHDVRVGQAGQRLRLAQQAGLCRGAGVGRAEQLERDAAPEQLVARQVDLAHAAASEHAEQRVAADPRGRREALRPRSRPRAHRRGRRSLVLVAEHHGIARIRRGRRAPAA
ncbi:hypothetical protein O0S08_32405 [Nannocystis poenicansa]|uniref:Uncharacterized protein n=1 Tax=Nannocystis punicea TaxID=2995304 RepID=A0ABY7GVE7_9BACT|nr:hypothetical protein [Nannocystis poenicansa]WAS90916.1 hypothetical protein O0S08_32405 [Nannocystis poenicansa]